MYLQVKWSWDPREGVRKGTRSGPVGKMDSKTALLRDTQFFIIGVEWNSERGLSFSETTPVPTHSTLEDGGGIFLLNICISLQDHFVPQQSTVTAVETSNMY
jgi:hypothetical protein